MGISNDEIETVNFLHIPRPAHTAWYTVNYNFVEIIRVLISSLSHIRSGVCLKPKTQSITHQKKCGAMIQQMVHTKMVLRINGKRASSIGRITIISMFSSLNLIVCITNSNNWLPIICIMLSLFLSLVRIMLIHHPPLITLLLIHIRLYYLSLHLHR